MKPKSVNEGRDNAYFRVIGDVHGLFRRYMDVATRAEMSIQVGDVGFDYEPMFELDASRHKCVGGNHDNYTRGDCECNGEGCQKCHGRGFLFINQPPHFLGDFGIWSVPMVGDIFFARGAWSIDWKNRIPGASWWDDEELKAMQMGHAHQLYLDTKPKIVVTHTCPDWIVDRMFASGMKSNYGPQSHFPRTEQWLGQLFAIHQPEIWFYGHYHHNWDQEIRGTRFICLDELYCFDFDRDETLQLGNSV
jgi:hypothetical protein